MNNYDIELNEGSYELDEDTGALKIYKEKIFNDYNFNDFEIGDIITILFSDEDGEVIVEYKLLFEDDVFIYLEYIGY